MNMDYYDHQRKHVISKESSFTLVSVWRMDSQNQEWKQKAQVGGCCSPSDANC